MKTLFSFAILAFVAISAQAAPCQPGSFSTYSVSGFSCTIDNLTFSSFSFAGSANPAGIAIPATAISVTPLSGPYFEGFTFSSGWNVATQMGGGSSFQDSLLSYTVTSPTDSITDAHLSFNGSFTGTGLTGVTENYCLNSATVFSCPAGSSGQMHVTNPPVNFDDNVYFFPAVSMISVTKDINVTSGIDGTASISAVVNTFTQTTPEPSTFVLLGSALVGVGLLRKRLSRSSV